jgi:hypothetical protein
LCSAGEQQAVLDQVCDQRGVIVEDDRAARPERDVLEHALRYRSMGLSVIPLHAHQKTPDYRSLRATGTCGWLGLPDWQVGAHRAATEAQVRRWFAGPGAGNIALVTGFADLIVLDFDFADSFRRWWDEHRHLQRTWVQATGRGYHVLYRCKERLRTSKFDYAGALAGDLIGHYRWVTVAPSLHPGGGRYRWLDGHSPWDLPLFTIDSIRQLDLVQHSYRGVRRRMRFFLKHLVRQPHITMQAFLKPRLERVFGRSS